MLETDNGAKRQRQWSNCTSHRWHSSLVEEYSHIRCFGQLRTNLLVKSVNVIKCLVLKNYLPTVTVQQSTWLYISILVRRTPLFWCVVPLCYGAFCLFVVVRSDHVLGHLTPPLFWDCSLKSLKKSIIANKTNFFSVIMCIRYSCIIYNIEWSWFL